MATERTRYGGRDNAGRARNTLVTRFMDNYLYFGISRCNSKAGDVFRKSQGRLIARERALKSVSELSQNQPAATFQLHESGLRGRVSVDKVLELLQYFDNIDEVMLAKVNDSYTSL